MSTVQSLEQERQAILDRMQMRRETYRRMLNDGEDLRSMPARTSLHAGDHAYGHGRPDHLNDGAIADQTAYSYRRVPDRFPRTRLMQTVSAHPMLWALGVAAVLAIGPRRIARTVTTGTAAAGGLASSQSGMDLIGRVLTLAGAYAQRKGS